MNASAPTLGHRATPSALLWLLLGISYAAALVTPRDLGPWGLLLAWVPVTFAFVHLFAWVGWRSGLAIFAIIAVVSFSYEALGVATGWVFGSYYYPEGPLGPLVLGVPPLIQLQYFAMGYACLMVSRAIGRALWVRVTGWPLIGISALGAFGMTALDLASDPMQSTVLGDWIWRDGGAFFGVPIHNFIGWFVVTGTFFVLVNLVLAVRPAASRLQERKPVSFYLQGVLLFGTFPIAIIIRPLLGTTPGGDASTIAAAMAGVALFAVLPQLLAAVMVLTRDISR